MCKTMLIETYIAAGGSDTDTEENLEAFKIFLRSYGHDTDVGDVTLDAIADTALYFHFDQIYTIKIESASSCEACRLNEPGQKAHMYEGGCMYNPESDWP